MSTVVRHHGVRCPLLPQIFRPNSMFRSRSILFLSLAQYLCIRQELGMLVFTAMV